MNKTSALKWINPLLALTFLVTAMGGMTRFFAPQLMDYELFRAIHPKFGIALVILAIMHIFLNGKWIMNTYFKK